MVATTLDPRKGRGNAQKKKKKKKKKKFHQVKVIRPFLLNKIIAHQLQNNQGRLFLQLTTEQPRKACFTSNYRTAEAGLLQS